MLQISGRSELVLLLLVATAGALLYLKTSWTSYRRVFPRQTMRQFIGDLRDMSLKPNQRIAKALQERGPIFWSTFLLIPVLTMIGKDAADFVAQAEKDGEIENSWPPSTISMLGKSSVSVNVGKMHALLRRLNAAAFKPDLLMQSIPKMQRIIQIHFIDRLGEQFEIVSGIQRVTTAIVFHCIFGVQDVASKEFERELDEWISLIIPWEKALFTLPINLPGFTYYKGLQARETLMNKLITFIRMQKERYIAGGKQEKDKTVLMVLMEANGVEGTLLSEYELAEQALTLFFAGYGTSASTLVSLFDLLMSNPHVLKKVRAENKEILGNNTRQVTNDDLKEMSYLEACIRETLRFRTPVPAVIKLVTKDTSYQGKFIAKGTAITLHLQASTLYYGDPDTDIDVFDPERFVLAKEIQDPIMLKTADYSNNQLTPAHIPFGVGKHACLGRVFAMLEMKLIMGMVLQEFDWVKVDIEPTEYEELPTPMPKDGLKLNFRRLNAIA